MTKVSVIVPVYNGEKHLIQCMDSICCQTLREIEIICVDDGSIDSSVDILKSYSKRDHRVKVLQQEHQYAGVARNLGKSKASGEYLVFWDCDDFFELTALEKLYNTAKDYDADVCVCSGNQYFDSKQKSSPCPSYLSAKYLPDTKVFNRFSWPDYYLYFTNAAAWNKIFRRKYIESLNLDFQPIRNGNDAYFTEVALGLADRITYIDERLITYRISQTSGLVNTLSKSPLSPVQAWIDIAEHLEKYPGFGERCFANKALSSIIYMLRNIQEWDAFAQAISVLKDHGLVKMHIFPHTDNYYYEPWKGICATHLYQDTAEQFALFLAHSMYVKRTEALAEKRALDKKFNQLKKSKRESNAKLQSAYDELENTVVKLRKTIRKLRQTNAQLEDKINDLINENNAHQIEIERLNNELNKTHLFKDGRH